MKILLIAAVLAAAGYGLLVVLASQFQNRLAFPGARGPLPSPLEVGFAAGEVVSITTPDSQQITGWYLPPENLPADSSPRPALMWFHGNRETVAGVGDFIRLIKPAGFALLAMDYRGYGTSTGTPTERRIYADAERAWDYLAQRPEVDSTRVFFYGRSVGSAVALELAQRRPVAGVILDSPFTSARDMGRRHYPFLPSSLRRLTLDNVTNARRLKAPLLVMHGEDDYIAPVEMGQAVANAGTGSFLVFPETGHNEMYSADPQRYRRTVHEFLSEVLGGSYVIGSGSGSGGS